MASTDLDAFMTKRAADVIAERFDHPPLAFVHSFGCQQNVADTEHIKGLLAEMGFGFTDSAENADFVLFNTCAVRESAEDRVFGNVGALKKIKQERPDMMIALCGCMMQQQTVADKIKRSYPYVDIVFGTGALHRLPAFIVERISQKKRIFCGEQAKNVVEGLPTVRDDSIKAWLPIMHGCDNFCSYCIVPYVRGRETSREPQMVIAEARELIEKGYKEITLLGQNVNSYGKNLEPKISFSQLLREIDAIEGEYRLHFMTSHPKDCTFELIDTIAESRHICHHIHLPVQSGNDRVLKVMNRHYDITRYRELIAYAKKRIPDVTFSSDIIVGFPGETREEFLDTLELIKEVRYNALFTFIYSRRGGT
ncbi:MAG: tRNA (N6-isopentenyl adenosine(37)-C2)-methylthiotransferase MiaB, partial [Oscillospiraceae bacterium]|nr:tRNA (N6-isopentenyl adenosine(37)-C2)-methylthiotransferase MiaB [Oscillospiraceae bacterium]